MFCPLYDGSRVMDTRLRLYSSKFLTNLSQQKVSLSQIVGTHWSWTLRPREVLSKERVEQGMCRPRERGNSGKGGGGGDPNVDPKNPNTALDFVKPYHAPAVSHLGVGNSQFFQGTHCPRDGTSEVFCSGTHRLETK